MKNTAIFKAFKNALDAGFDKAIIRSIDIDRISITIDNAPNIIRNVEVIGDASTLVVGQEVNITRVDGRPVAVVGNGSAAFSTLISAMAPHTHLDAASGGVLEAYMRKYEHNDMVQHVLGTNVPHDSHGNLTDLSADHHPHYASAEGSGTRRAYEAGRLNRQITAGDGLTGGGLLTSDVGLSVGAGNGIEVLSDSVGVKLTTDGGLSVDVNGLSAKVNSAGGLMMDASGLGVKKPATSGLVVDANGVSVDWGYAPVWTGSHLFQNTLTSRNHIPEITDTYDLGSTTRLWRKAYISELETVMFGQGNIAVVGGWMMITKDEGTLGADLGDMATIFDFGKAMVVGDFILLRSFGQVEYLSIGALVSGTTYNIDRNLDGSGANSWPAGTPYIVLGQSGDGRIELNAFDTPRIQLITQGATYNTQSETIRIGDLNGNWGYAVSKWGVAIGKYEPDKANITIDEDGGLRIRNYNIDLLKFYYDTSFKADIAGTLRLPDTTSALSIGAVPPASATSGTGLWIDRTGLYSLSNSVYQIKIDALNGTLFAGSGKVLLDATGVKIRTASDGIASLLFEAYPYQDHEDGICSMSGYHGLGSNIFTISASRSPSFPYGEMVLTTGNTYISVISGSSGYGNVQINDPTWYGLYFSVNALAFFRDGIVIGGLTDAGIPDTGTLWLKEISNASTPNSTFGALYAKTDSNLYFKNDVGLEYLLSFYHNNAVYVGEGQNGQVIISSASSLEIGKQGRTVDDYALIDFHTSVSSPDYDSRILAEGGSSAGAGQGKITFMARDLFVNSDTQGYGRLSPSTGFTMFIEEGGAVIATGVKLETTVFFPFEATYWFLTSVDGITGSVTGTLEKRTWGSGTWTTIATITISSGWVGAGAISTNSFAWSDQIRFNISSITSFKKLDLTIQGRKI